MSVNLRDRLFNDTGGVVQGATVQAILVTGGATDAGTSSVVQATTSTDVNGVWKFAALPDPGTGNWYDVKLINGNQVRWRYGNIQASLNALLMSNTSYQVVALGIGTTPPATGLQVQAGNVGIGTAPSTNYALVIGGGPTTVGTTQAGLLSAPTFPAAASAFGIGVQAQAGLASGAFSVNNLAAFYASNPAAFLGGAASATVYGLYVEAITRGSSDNYGVFINSPSGGATENAGLVNLGGTRLTPSAYVAGDKYLVVDASGNVHVSTLSPGA